MNARDAMRESIERSGMTKSDVSRRINRSRQFVATVLKKKCTPAVDTLGVVLAACGYKLCAEKEPTDDAIVIDMARDGKRYSDIIREGEQDDD